MRQSVIAIVLVAIVALNWLPAFGSGNWSTFVEPTSGLKFAYPSEWEVVQNPESDCLLKISGVNSKDSFGELKLEQSKDFIEPSKELVIAEQVFFPKLTNYKKVSSGPLTFGRRSQFSGTTANITFSLGDLTVHQQFVFFCLGHTSYTIVLTTPVSGLSELRLVFQNMLGNLDRAAVHPSNSRSGARSGSSPVGLSLTQFSDESLPVKLSYPAGWKISRESSDQDKGIKFEGSTAGGSAAALQIWYRPRFNLSLEYLTDLLEQNLFKPLPHYQRVAVENTSVSGASGIQQYATFAVDGVPAKHYAVFFVDSDNFYCLSLSSVTCSQKELHELFDRIKGTVQLRFS